MRPITLALLFIIMGVQLASAQKKSSISEMYAVIRAACPELEKKVDIIRTETGILRASSDDNGSYLFEDIKRKLYSGKTYRIVVCTSTQVQDFTLKLFLKNSDGKWELVGNPVNNSKNQTSPLGDLEAITITPAQDGEYAVSIRADNRENRTARYAAFFCVATPQTPISELLDKTALKYTVSNEGNYKITIPIGSDGRTQVVTLSKNTQTHEKMEIREIWSKVEVFQNENAISDEDKIFLLKANSTLKMGSWQLAGEREPYALCFSLMISANLDNAEDLKKMLTLVGETSDQMETRFHKNDNY